MTDDVADMNPETLVRTGVIEALNKGRAEEAPT
jgi:hypothetical protein